MLPLRSPGPVPTPRTSLGERAASDLSFIRSAMERSGRFTAVSGTGGLFMGAVALVAAALSFGPGLALREGWPLVWVLAAAVAGPGNVGFLVRKARAQGLSLLRGRGRDFLLGLCPPLVAGAVLTGVLLQAGSPDLLPATWLLLYGTAVMTGGTTSIPLVPALGALFLLLGALAALVPVSGGVALLAVGFGGLHLASGLWIRTHHGG